MEKCVDADYPETQYDSSKSSETWSSLLSIMSKNNQRSNKIKESLKVSTTRKKIAGEKRSEGRCEERKNVANANGGEKSVKREGKGVTKLNVLKGRLMSARHSVQNNTKTFHRNVPDRLGKYVNSNVRPETNLFLKDCDSVAEPSNDASPKSFAKSEDVGFTFEDCTETKSNMIGNECLRNKESAHLDDSIEFDMEEKNIFEKIFDDSLGSTSVVKDASSQGNLNLETDDESVMINSETVNEYSKLLDKIDNLKKDDARMIEKQKSPVRKVRLHSPPNAPVKVKDHGSYYGNKKIRHVCGYCHKIFKSNGKLNSHVYSHTGERPFDCNHCGKAFSSKFKLVRHLLIHSEIRKFVCQICDRTFLRNDHLKNHYKIHDPQKKMYKCPKEHCDKEYSSMMSHKKHMAYHSVEDGDLKCLICNVKFETKEDVLFHLKSHSGSRLFKSQSDKKFKCDFCDRLFLTRKDVTRHLVVHTGERDFLCQFCPQRFGRKDHLVRHIKKSHVNEGMSVKNEINQLLEQKEDKKGTASTSPKKCTPAASSISKPTANNVDKEDETVNLELEDGEGGSTEDASEKTHIVITVKKPLQKRKSKSSDHVSKDKSFRKNDSTTQKKHLPLPKNKSSTTQIFLQNIPNILIIPNNSIILLRNQSGSNSKTKKVPETMMRNENEDKNDKNSNAASVNSNGNTDPENVSTISTAHSPVSGFQFGEDFLTRPMPNSNYGEESSATTCQSDGNFNLNYNYGPTVFQQQQQPPPMGYQYGDTFSNFQSEMLAFGQQLENLNMEMLTQGDLTKRTESNFPAQDDAFPAVSGLPDSPSSCKLTEGNAQPPDLHRKIGIVKPMTKTLDMEKDDLFGEVPENLMMADSILNDFKVDDSVALPLDNDGGILNNIFGQTSLDGAGNELLRSLLLSENSMLSPLPGFNQIFQNSNTN